MRRHLNFLIALAVGLAVFAACFGLPIEVRALVGVVAFFFCDVALMLRRAQRITPSELRRHAENADEGLPLILGLAVLAVGVSLTAIFLVLNAPGGSPLVLRFFALSAVPLGWAMVQILLGFHYAQLFYRPHGDAHRGGLAFPECDTPGAWDFLYFSFGIGMTAQVSDVQVTTPSMRKAVTLHAVASFFYNAVILALAVNAAVTATL